LNDLAQFGHGAVHAHLDRTDIDVEQGCDLGVREICEVPEVDDEPPMSYIHHDTDTASLLRELSSLGLDDDPPPPPVRPPSPSAPRPVATAPAKKKKGLFGR